MRIAGSAAESNVGRKRRHNEDSYVSAPPVFAVADGMGGAQAGEVASALAAGTVTEAAADPGATPEQRVVSLIKAANLRVHERAASDASVSGMGTTMTVADGLRRREGHDRPRRGLARLPPARTTGSSSSPTTTRSSPSSSGAAS